MGEFAHPNVLAYSTTSVLTGQYMQVENSPRNECFYGTCQHTCAQLPQPRSVAHVLRMYPQGSTPHNEQGSRPPLPYLTRHVHCAAFVPARTPPLRTSHRLSPAPSRDVRCLPVAVASSDGVVVTSTAETHSTGGSNPQHTFRTYILGQAEEPHHMML
jgi:hypothetical protein